MAVSSVGRRGNRFLLQTRRTCGLGVHIYLLIMNEEAGQGSAPSKAFAASDIQYSYTRRIGTLCQAFIDPLGTSLLFIIFNLQSR